MRRVAHLPVEGAHRSRTFFAWIPVTIWGDLEGHWRRVDMRWLERVTVEERYNGYLGKWSPMRFVDEEQKP